MWAETLSTSSILDCFGRWASSFVLYQALVFQYSITIFHGRSQPLLVSFSLSPQCVLICEDNVRSQSRLLNSDAKSGVYSYTQGQDTKYLFLHLEHEC